MRPGAGGSPPSDWEVLKKKSTTPIRMGFLQVKPGSPPPDRLLQVEALTPTSGRGFWGWDMSTG